MRKSRPAKVICKRGHNTSIVGRDLSGACRECRRIFDRSSRSGIQQALRNATSRAKEKRLPINLTVAHLMDILPKNSKCPKLGIVCKFNRGIGGKRRQSDDSWSLDRLFNNLGYVIGNVRWVSWRYNNIKSNVTAIEAKILYEDLKIVEAIMEEQVKQESKPKEESAYQRIEPVKVEKLEDYILERAI